MNTSEYDRRVLAHVALYGVSDARVEPGGKHRKLRFTYRDKPVTVTMASSPSDADAAVVKIGDIVRALGHPPTCAEKRIPRKLENMLPAAYPTVTKEQPMIETQRPPIGGLIHYADRLKFVFPLSLVTDHAGGWSAERDSNDSWSLRPSLRRKTPRLAPDRSLMFGSPASLHEGLPLFGHGTQAEYLHVDGCVMVRLLLDTVTTLVRKPLKQLRGFKVDAEIRDLAAIRAEQVKQALIDDEDIVDEADMRAALAAVRRVEAGTAYRIARTKEGGLAFVAPRIE